MTTHRTTRILAVVLLAIPLALAACGGGSNEVSGGETTEVSGGSSTEVLGGGAVASCAFIVHYDGRAYMGNGVAVAPVQGVSLGTGTIPPCNDTGGLGTGTPAEEVEVAEIEGVSPTVRESRASRPRARSARPACRISAHGSAGRAREEAHRSRHRHG